MRARSFRVEEFSQEGSRERGTYRQGRGLVQGFRCHGMSIEDFRFSVLCFSFTVFWGGLLGLPECSLCRRLEGRYVFS